MVEATGGGTSRLVVMEFTGVGASPLDGHAVGECNSCSYQAPTNTANFSVTGNDLVWTWCGSDNGGTYESVGTQPQNNYTAISTGLPQEYLIETYPQPTAGTVYGQCSASPGFAMSIAIKGN